MIDIDYLKQLLDIFDESSINDLKIEKDGTAIRLTKRPKTEVSEPTNYHYVPPSISAPVVTPLPEQAVSSNATNSNQPVVESTTSAEEATSNDQYHEIRSPIVGTFYSAPNPEADPFVEVGDDVSDGDVLCIVEAMKLMNEIESDVSGRIVKILVENAQPVEYNQVLFLIEQ